MISSHLPFPLAAPPPSDECPTLLLPPPPLPPPTTLFPDPDMLPEAEPLPETTPAIDDEATEDEDDEDPLDTEPTLLTGLIPDSNRAFGNAASRNKRDAIVRLGSSFVRRPSTIFVGRLLVYSCVDRITPSGTEDTKFPR